MVRIHARQAAQDEWLMKVSQPTKGSVVAKVEARRMSSTVIIFVSIQRHVTTKARPAGYLKEQNAFLRPINHVSVAKGVSGQP
jgi:hypothetical protein